ncbi:MAG: class I SAM-dependent RNA methyltransferase [Treponema sp.]|nr:class I SAM-dependent RNA methyltransferase [Treponema sp.]
METERKIDAGGTVFPAAALCAVGAEKIVSRELQRLGLNVEESGFGRVRFRAELGGLYRALMALRVADRVLLEAGCFSATDFDALFEGTRQAAWEEWIPRDMGLVVEKVRSSRSVLKAETSIQAVVHKAAAERLCTAYGRNRLPEGEKTANLRVYIDKDRVLLLLDLSGAPLFKRGYRLQGGIAPLRETTAAALLHMSLWRRKFPLYDPFCGSGTILAEALLYAWDAAPGLGRRFALDDLLIADPALEESLRAGLLEQVNFEHTIRIGGSDRDPQAVSLATSTIRRVRDLALGRLHGPADRSGPSPGSTEPPELSKMPELPELRCLPMEDARSPFGTAGGEGAGGEAAEGETTAGEAGGGAGFIITNPPYGRRLGEPGEAEARYAAMTALRRGFPGWKLGVITDHPGFESFFGRPADSCREITNGVIGSYFFQYGNL